MEKESNNACFVFVLILKVLILCHPLFSFDICCYARSKCDQVSQCLIQVLKFDETIVFNYFGFISAGL